MHITPNNQNSCSHCKGNGLGVEWKGDFVPHADTDYDNNIICMYCYGGTITNDKKTVKYVYNRLPHVLTKQYDSFSRHCTIAQSKTTVNYVKESFTIRLHNDPYY